MRTTTSGRPPCRRSALWRVALLGVGEDPGVLVPTAPGLFAPDLVAKLSQKARPAVVRLPVRKAGPFCVTIPTFTRELVPQERAPRTALR